MQPLPIDSLIPQIKSSLQSHPNLIIEAAPGAGKTTRIPPALLDPAIAGSGEVWVLEPRRIAARLSARRVAEELGERLGESVGYQVRFEEIGSPRTRLRFLTEGVLTRRLLRNAKLNGVAAIVLDEFHERHLQSDLGLALLRHLQTAIRPELKIIVMSATLEAAPLAEYLGNCPILRSEGRRYDVSITYQKEYDAAPLANQVAGATRKILASQADGDILVFLPGAAEIKRAQAACAEFAAQAKLLVLPLHGELSTSEQDAAVRPANQRKVILATNVAETSITIEGIGAVIDSGLARIASHSSWSGLPTLNTQRVSKASAIQRAGRAGRTRAGQCLRLYTEIDYAARSDYETPEIQRLDLAGAMLDLSALGIQDISKFVWYEPPTTEALEAAIILLRQLGAITQAGKITEMGKRMARFPLHPRQSRIFVEAEKRGCPNRGALIAALIGERDLRARNTLSAPAAREPSGNSDLFAQEALFLMAQKSKFDPIRLQEIGINPGAYQVVKRATEQILRLRQQPVSDNGLDGDGDEDGSEELIKMSVLTGYADQVAKRQASDNDQVLSGVKTLLLMNGATAQLAADSGVGDAEFIVAIEAEEKKVQRHSMIVVRSALAIKADWLLDLFPDSVREQIHLQWNAAKERVELLSQLCYGQLILAESRIEAKQVSATDQTMVAHVLADAAIKKGWQHFFNEADINHLLSRLDFIHRNFPASSLPCIEESQLDELLVASCEGKSSFLELREILTTEGVLQQFLSFEQISLLNRLAPERVTIAGRKNVRVNYELGKQPWIASRLQDFFGMTASPTIGQGSVPLVLHLLAPNQRPVQVTSDLAGFWARIYPQVRRELSRRYPKHAWPENPLQNEAKAKQKI